MLFLGGYSLSQSPPAPVDNSNSPPQSFPFSPPLAVWSPGNNYHTPITPLFNQSPELKSFTCALMMLIISFFVIVWFSFYLLRLSAFSFQSFTQIVRIDGFYLFYIYIYILYILLCWVWITVWISIVWKFMVSIIANMKVGVFSNFDWKKNLCSIWLKFVSIANTPKNDISTI